MNDHHDPDAACARVRGRLDELDDGALAALEAARDEGHLEACAACAAERERRRAEAERWRAALSPAPQAWEHATAGLAARLATARSPSLPRAPRAWKAALRAASLAAACVLALVGLVELGVVDLARELEGGRASARALLSREAWPIDLDRVFGGD
jgi:anti-sigma factor RsiW